MNTRPEPDQAPLSVVLAGGGSAGHVNPLLATADALRRRVPQVRVEVLGNSFDDSAGKATNYMIDLPEGATGRIAGNWFVQGRDKENYSTFIAVAAEHQSNPSDGLTVADNDARFAPGVSRASVFVGDWSGARLAVGANTLGVGLKLFEKR